jgi:chromosome segregation ATPase
MPSTSENDLRTIHESLLENLREQPRIPGFAREPDPHDMQATLADLEATLADAETGVEHVTEARKQAIARYDEDIRRRKEHISRLKHEIKHAQRELAEAEKGEKTTAAERGSYAKKATRKKKSAESEPE